MDSQGPHTKSPAKHKIFLSLYPSFEETSVSNQHLMTTETSFRESHKHKTQVTSDNSRSTTKSASSNIDIVSSFQDQYHIQKQVASSRRDRLLLLLIPKYKDNRGTFLHSRSRGNFRCRIACRFAYMSRVGFRKNLITVILSQFRDGIRD